MTAKVPCFQCGGETQPAALDPNKLWCTKCAREMTLDGKEIVPKVKVMLPEKILVDEKAPPPIAHPVQQAQGPNGSPADDPTNLSAPDQPEGPIPRLRSFEVTIGDITFRAHGRFDLFIGKTKISIK